MYPILKIDNYMPYSAGTAPKTAKNTITMRTYRLQKDEQDRIPPDAQNLRQERVRGELIVQFESDTGPIEENTDDCGCEQCSAEDEATPNNLTPRRKTPEGWE